LSGDVTFGSALTTFDPQASSKYTAVEVNPDGVIIRGTVSMSWRPDPVVDYAESPDGTFYTALKSWIPAGTVDQYTWSWVSAGDSLIPWDGVPNVVLQVNRFTLPAPAPEVASVTGQICLLVEGTHITSTTGTVVPVPPAGSTCKVRKPNWLASLPAWLNALLLVPVWTPDPPWDSVLSEGIVAHVNVLAASERSAPVHINTLIYVAADHSLASLSVLREAVLRSGRYDALLSGIVVLPEGSFSQMRATRYEGAGSLARALGGRLLITEDYEGGWSRALEAVERPATFLVNAQGELAWQRAGSLDAASISAALDEHLVAGGRARSSLSRLAVRVGDLAPDFLFEYAEGKRLALRRLRGQSALLTFWKSWSTPCLAELRRLEFEHARAGVGGPVILAVADGDDPSRVAAVGRELGLSFTLVPDPDRRISRRYGVNCWPTAISIEQNGLVDRVHFGLTPSMSASTPRAG
jgi:peroxiredoxin